MTKINRGRVYLIRKDETDSINTVSVETDDGRFFRLHKKGKKFEDEFHKCMVGDVVEWTGTTHFKILK